MGNACFKPRDRSPRPGPTSAPEAYAATSPPASGRRGASENSPRLASPRPPGPVAAESRAARQTAASSSNASPRSAGPVAAGSGTTRQSAASSSNASPRPAGPVAAESGAARQSAASSSNASPRSRSSGGTLTPRPNEQLVNLASAKPSADTLVAFWNSMEARANRTSDPSASRLAELYNQRVQPEKRDQATVTAEDNRASKGQTTNDDMKLHRLLMVGDIFNGKEPIARLPPWLQYHMQEQATEQAIQSGEPLMNLLSDRERPTQTSFVEKVYKAYQIYYAGAVERSKRLGGP